MISQNWKSKKARKEKHANNNPGGQKKGFNCQTDPQKKFFFTSCKAFRHREYEKWHEKAKALNK